MALPAYAGPLERSWYYAFRIICAAIFVFLIAPIIIIIPLSFNAEPYFTFTRAMLTLDPEGYSLRWYQDFLASDSWMHSIKNSFIIAIGATIIATTLGTLAALGLSRSHMPFKAAIMGILISPMIVPLIISAAGMFFFYSKIGLAQTYPGIILAHAALGTPFVVITVTATLLGLRPQPDPGSGQPRCRSDHHLLQGDDAADPARRDLGRLVRLHHLLRRGGHRALPRRRRAAHHPARDVVRHSRGRSARPSSPSPPS